ncbi:MAG: fluoride efflux transporter CrcB [Akkermansiaceae bacterium]
MNHILLIFIGSGLGATARYILSLQLQSEGSKMPYGILTANLLGCLLIGIIYGLVKSHHPTWISPLAVTGFLGGFTTFSTFALDTQKLIQSGNLTLAITYSLISLLGGLALCFIGFYLVQR